MELDHETALFFIACLGLSLIASPRNAQVWRILASISFLNILLNFVALDSIDSKYIPLIAGLFETLTISLIIHRAFCLLGLGQALIIAVAWGIHLALYFDLILGGFIVYVHYESLMLAVSSLQLALGWNDVARNIRDLWSRSVHLSSSLLLDRRGNHCHKEAPKD